MHRRQRYSSESSVSKGPTDTMFVVGRNYKRKVKTMITLNSASVPFSQNYREGKITESFRDVYEELLGIRSKLEKLSLMHNWSLRQTDLYEFERQLVAIDEARVNGKFVDAEGNEGDIFMQRVSFETWRT